MSFEKFIKNKGIEYEKQVMNNFNGNFITISGFVKYFALLHILGILITHLSLLVIIKYFYKIII